MGGGWRATSGWRMIKAAMTAKGSATMLPAAKIVSIIPIPLARRRAATLRAAVHSAPFLPFTSGDRHMVLAGFGGWVASGTHARVIPPATVQINPFQAMINAKNLPTQHFDDY